MNIDDISPVRRDWTIPVFESKTMDTRGMASQVVGREQGRVPLTGCSYSVSGRELPKLYLPWTGSRAKLVMRSYEALHPFRRGDMGTLYGVYRWAREDGLNAEAALQVARRRIALETADKLLLGTDTPTLTDAEDLIGYAQRGGTTITVNYAGVDLHVCVEQDSDFMVYDESWEVSVSHVGASLEEEGWIDIDLGVYRSVSTRVEHRIEFMEGRQDILEYAPKGMSKQMAYEWATRSMNERVKEYERYRDGEAGSLNLTIMADDEVLHSLGGISLSDIDNPTYFDAAYMLEEINIGLHDAKMEVRRMKAG